MKTCPRSSVDTFNLRNGDGPVEPLEFKLRDNDQLLQIFFGPLTAGDYELVIDGTAVTDRARNQLGDGDIVSPFTVTAPPLFKGQTTYDEVTPIFPDRVFETGGPPVTIATSDMNNDDILDLVTANGDFGLSVLIANADGTYRERP